MRWLIVVAAVLAGCVGPVRLMKWRADDRSGLISIPLQPGAAQPSQLQHDQATQIATEHCGGRFSLVEEGTDVTRSPYLTAFGGVAAMGEEERAAYYWVVKCGG